ncbi:ferredoxin [Streptomyces sp. NPDC049949]|uniref:ferredoxin n=1 Tax=Streptomyces sp. NPDC049949 TaxID=3154627 RepID=UPI0034190B70
MSDVTWTVRIDAGLCLGSGICAGTAPEVFALEDDHARPRTDRVAAQERILEAADMCPAQAITVHDGTSVIGPRPA